MPINQTHARVGLMAALLAVQAPGAMAQGPPGGVGGRVAMRTLSTHADRVSGGDVLVVPWAWFGPAPETFVNDAAAVR